MSRLRVLFYAAAIILQNFSASAQTVTNTLTISGKLKDGTTYGVNKPENWNGILVLDLDGAMPVRGFTKWLFDQGYATGGTSRGECGYNFPACVDNLKEVRALFAEKFGVPRYTIVTGNSRGGFVARMAIELYPDVFNGAMTSSGGGAGSIAGMNSKLDAVWSLKTLLNPSSPLRLVNIANKVAEENAALTALLKEAMASPQGRARLGLAAAFEQFPSWADRNTPPPAANDCNAWIDQISSSFAFANPATVRAGMEQAAGGIVSWNNGIDYRRLLEQSGRKDMVLELYKNANLDLEADLAILEKAPRISANPEALSRAEPLMTYTGKISGPIIVVDNDDPVDAAPLKIAYIETLKKAGTIDLCRICWVNHAGHGGQTDIERITGFVTLMNRLTTGKWDDTSPEAMNTRAEKLAKEYSISETSAFFDYKPPMPLRTWDKSNWKTYQPAQ